ncbi:MAG: signal peptidase I, partial [Acidimicrobiales bacterium]
MTDPSEGADKVVEAPDQDGELPDRDGEGDDHDDEGDDHREVVAGPRRSGAKVLVEWVIIVVVALGAALLIKTFLIEAYEIPSASMVPTLIPHDRVLVNKLSYHLHSVHRADIVVFKRPVTDIGPGHKILIKRVIGLPGESIEGKNGQIYIDGKLLPEPWL